jgi:hypothetical protein
MATMTFQDGGYFDSKSTWVTSYDPIFISQNVFPWYIASYFDNGAKIFEIRQM